MKYQEFIKSIIAGKIAPVYFFYGEETYLIDQGVNKIEKKIVTPNTASFNRNVFYGEEADASQIVNTALSIPMMAKKQVVIVKNFQRLSQSGKELILNYCRKPAPHTVMVLIAESVDFRKKLYSELKSLSGAVDCKPLYDNQVPIYIQQFVKDRGKTIDPGAIQLLQARLGNSLRDLINEIDKLIQFDKEKSEITEDDVEELVGISRSYNVFQLWDALGEKNFEQSLTIVRYMLETGENPVFLVVSITNYFLRLWRIRALKRNRTEDAQIGKILHIHPYFLKQSIRQASRYSDQNLKSIFNLLLHADVSLKTSYQEPQMVLELLIFQILRNQKAA